MMEDELKQRLRREIMMLPDMWKTNDSHSFSRITVSVLPWINWAFGNTWPDSVSTSL